MAKLEVWANMPVKDIERTRDFFEQLGFKLNGGHDNKDLASFIFSEGHFVIHFFREEKFSQETGNPVSDTSRGTEIVFTIAAGSKAAVDQWREKVVQAGGTVVTEPMEIPFGYNFVFADLDGHRWNAFYHKPK